MTCTPACNVRLAWASTHHKKLLTSRGSADRNDITRKQRLPRKHLPFPAPGKKWMIRVCVFQLGFKHQKAVLLVKPCTVHTWGVGGN